MWHDLLTKNFLVTIIFIGMCFVLILGYRIYKFYRITELDKAFRQFDPNTGKIIQEGHKRPIWDYHWFPGLSKLWHVKEWGKLVAVIIFSVLLVLYLIYNDENFIRMLGINFGLIIGMMISKEK